MSFNLDIVKSGGEYVSCKELQWGLTLVNDRVASCCAINKNNAVYDFKLAAYDIEYPFLTPVLDKNTAFDKDFFDNMLEAKFQLINKLNSGEHCICSGCENLIFREWEPMTKLKFNRLILSPDNLCNSSCSYCPQDHARRSRYDHVGLLNRCIELGYIDPNNTYKISWGGGEPVLMEGFDELFVKFKDVKIYNQIFTTGIKFSENIANALQDDDNTCILVSIDAGTRDTYKKIKSVDQFDRVVENFDKYYKSAKNKSNIKLKYIVLDENCTIEEIDSFLALVKSKGWVGITIVVSIDMFIENLSNDVRRGVHYLALKAPFVSGSQVVSMLGNEMDYDFFNKYFNTSLMGKLGYLNLLTEQNGVSLDKVIEFVENYEINNSYNVNSFAKT